VCNQVLLKSCGVSSGDHTQNVELGMEIDGACAPSLMMSACCKPAHMLRVDGPGPAARTTPSSPNAVIGRGSHCRCCCCCRTLQCCGLVPWMLFPLPM
jgi:hypothetical protein